MIRHKAVKPDSSFAHDATTLENEVSLLRKQEPASPVATVRRNCTSRYAVILIGLVGGWWLLQFPSNWISGVKNECDTSLQEGQGIDASHSGIRNRNQPTTVAPTMNNGATLAKIEEFQPIQITLPACASNPYKSAINEHFPTVVQTAQEWLNHQDAYNQIAEQTIYTHWDHRRFFPFDPMASCKDLQCIGGACSEDRSKIACGMDHLSRLDKCVVYSIGSNNFWEFEQDILKRTNCDVFTFDCTGSLSRFKVPNEERLHFHHICVGAQSLKGKGEEGCTGNTELCGDTWTLEEIQQHLGHSKVDLLKLDIEGMCYFPPVDFGCMFFSSQVLHLLITATFVPQRMGVANIRR